MKQWPRYRTPVVAVLMVLAISALWTVPALADDTTPPPTATPEVVQPSGESSSTQAAPVTAAANPEVSEAALTEAPTTTEAPVMEASPTEVQVIEASATETAVVVETTPAEGSASQDGTTAEALAQLPDNTDVVALDKNGEAVSLASQEASDILDSGDPIWCPVTVLVPVNGGAGCSSSFGSMQEVIDYLNNPANQKSVAGIIWIAKDYDSSVNDLPAASLTLNGSLMGTTANFALTLKGGWNGLGAGTVDTTDPSEFNVPLSITNWNADITLSDILITNVTTPGSVALTVDATKNITLTRVTAGTNAGSGTSLDNYHAGTGTGNITVTSGNFSGNAGGYGLSARSGGTITLSSVTADGNASDGVDLDNGGAATPKNVTLTSGSFEFNDNIFCGLRIWSKGAVTLKDITANANHQAGATIDNTAGSGAVSLSGTNIFSDNTLQGLAVWSKGAITASNVIANSNQNSWGAELHNENAAGAMPVTLTGSSEFKFNGGGLMIISRGAITLNKITASNNRSDAGAYLVNLSSGSAVPQNVTLLGYGNFHNNFGNGLTVQSYGAIALTNVSANDNGGYGAYLDNSTGTLPRPVTLSLTAGNPDTDFLNDYSGGLVIYSRGAISLSGVDASGSANGNGTTLNNDYPGAVGGITIGGWGAAFNDNTGYGITAFSQGAITLTNLWAWGNDLAGALLDNSDGTSAVTIAGDSGFGNNTWYGLEILSSGAITLGTISAQSNGGPGAMLDNTGSGALAPQNVTLNGSHHDFNSNGSNGLAIYSYGMITSNNLYASDNLGSGVLLDNCLQFGFATCTANLAKAITLNGNNTFEWNDGNGLELASKGLITVNNLIARDNGGYGAFLRNQMPSALSGVTVKNTPTYGPEFARNGKDGLRILSNGSITVMDLDAYDNGQDSNPSWGHGVYLDNASGGGTGNISLGTSRATWVNGLDNNFLSGLEAFSNGTVTLSNLSADDNGHDNTVDPIYGYGVYVKNSTSSLPKAVTLKGTNEFINDWSGGLYILSKGTITLNNLTANDSTNGNGVILYNTASGAGAPQNITLTGYGDFINNYLSGLEVHTYGTISLNNVSANDNGQSGSTSGYGVLLDNLSGSTLVRPVVLNGITTNNNYTGGLHVQSLGAITISNLNADWNSGFGAFLDNSGGTSVSGVTINAGAFTSNNDSYGLLITTRGAITMNVTDAWAGNNGSYGWDLDNSLGAATSGITLTSPNSDWAFDFASNAGGFGLLAQSLGNITISGLDAFDNGGYGVTLNNAFPGSVGTVTVTAAGHNEFNGNYGSGLYIISNRAITINNLYADSNASEGVILTNTFSGPGSPQNVTVTGSGEFYNNGNTGLIVDTYGLITLNNISANDNGQNNFNAGTLGLSVDPNTGWGAHLNNHTGAVNPQGIILNGTNSFNGNYQDGLWATSLGVIKVNAITANINGLDGAYLNNEWTGAAGGITLTTSTPTGWNVFNGNGSWGLDVYSGGSVTLSNITANGNLAGGTRVQTLNNFGPANVTLSGRNTFSGNGDALAGTGPGLQVYATGMITLNNVTANGNGTSGAYLDNWYAGPVLPLTISLMGVNTFNGNGTYGLVFHTYGNVSLTKVTADQNGNTGVWGETHGAIPGKITLSCGSMNENGLYGWYLSTLGTVTLNGVFGYGNGMGNFSSIPTILVRTCPLP